MVMSCSRATCSAMADGASAHSANPVKDRNANRLIGEVAMMECRPVSLVLDLEAARADIDLQALRFLLGLIKIVAQHAHRDDQCADDEIQDIAVAGHRASPWFV